MQSFEYFRRITNSDEKYMQICLDLAVRGFGSVSPNPMVGAVVVYQDQIIGRGFHEKWGEAHAEVNAIRHVENQTWLKEATVYVNLEPCSHYGKTAPCADLLIQHQVKKVVIGALDPNPLVAGRGMAKLRAAGIETSCGILEQACRLLNKRFYTQHEKHRPYTILKWAESADGFMAGEAPVQISGSTAKALLHQWRSEEDAFLVGTETLLKDNPSLSNRLYSGKNPLRIAVDFHLKSLNLPLNFYDNSLRTLILNGLKEEKTGNTQWVKIPNKSPVQILEAIHGQGVQSLVIEGGPRLLNSFIEAGLYDEVRQFVSKNKFLKTGIKAPVLTQKVLNSQDLMDDILNIY